MTEFSRIEMQADFNIISTRRSFAEPIIQPIYPSCEKATILVYEISSWH